MTSTLETEEDKPIPDYGQWLAELAHLRASVGPARSGAPTTEEILEELRAERAAEPAYGVEALAGSS